MVQPFDTSIDYATTVPSEQLPLVSLMRPTPTISAEANLHPGQMPTPIESFMERASEVGGDIYSNVMRQPPLLPPLAFPIDRPSASGQDPTTQNARPPATTSGSFTGSTDQYLSMPAPAKDGLKRLSLADEPDSTSKGTGYMKLPGEGAKFKGTMDQFLALPDNVQQQQKEMTFTNMKSSEPYGISYPKKSAEDERLEYDVKTSRQEAELARLKQEDSIAKVRQAREELQQASKVLSEQRSQLPTGMNLASLERFVSNADTAFATGGGVSAIMEKARNGEQLSRREQSFLSAYDESRKTLDSVRRVEAAIAEVPVLEQTLDRQLQMSLAEPAPMDPDTVEKVIRAQYSEKVQAKQDQKDQRELSRLSGQESRLRRELSQIQRALRAIDKKDSAEKKSFEDAVEAQLKAQKLEKGDKDYESKRGAIEDALRANYRKSAGADKADELMKRLATVQVRAEDILTGRDAQPQPASAPVNKEVDDRLARDVKRLRPNAKDESMRAALAQ